MGKKVARLHRHSRVGARSSIAALPDLDVPPALGFWLARERQLRGLSREWLTARLNLAPDTLAAIESGEQVLLGDGPGRSTARTLAQAIGADPEAAVALLGRAPRAHRSRRRPRRVFTGVAIGTALAAVALGAGVGLRALWSSLGTAPGVAARSPARVYRPDYVARLLGSPEPAIESTRALRDNPPRP